MDDDGGVVVNSGVDGGICTYKEREREREREKVKKGIKSKVHFQILCLPFTNLPNRSSSWK
jgi:hypothetical protein